MTVILNRRTLIQGGLAAGAVAWAGHTAWSRSQSGERPRLVLFMLAGGADGLSLAPPRSDPRYLELRGPLAIASPLPFAQRFGLHPSLTHVSAMARAGQVRLAPAAANPTRTRSHGAEAQTLLTGALRPSDEPSGWLNRALVALAPKEKLQAVSLEALASDATLGPATFGALVPGGPALDVDRLDALKGLYRNDAQLSRLLAMAAESRTDALAVSADLPPQPLAARAALAGRLLARPDGPTAAFLSQDGYDTHQDQGAERGRLADRLRELDEALGALRTACGEAWAHTMVLVCTEFGRTAQANGSGGSDHGVASAALLLGGAVKPGPELGDWPGLDPRALHEGRDLAPGLDVRALFKGVLLEHWGLSRATLDGSVFPGSSGVAPLAGVKA